MSIKGKIAKLEDLLSIKTIENGEKMVLLSPSLFRLEYKKTDMKEILGERMYVRESISKKLESAQKDLQKKNSNWLFLITYAYRSPEIQEKYFNQRLEEVKKDDPSITDQELSEKAHAMSADPRVAGHPTGGALDITIFDNSTQNEIDMGSDIAEFGDIASTFFPDISEQQKNNRLLLKEILESQGFAPFLDEWWHFSYGDKEWAFYYDKPNAIYDKISVEKLNIRI